MKMTSLKTASVWFVRLTYLIVFIINVACALQFVIAPQDYLYAYELSGVSGSAAIRGIGIAFLMWNVTYPAVIVNPRRFKALSVVVLVQQVIGLVGETYILFTLPSGHDILAASILRFILFDAVGLLLMAIAFGCLLILTCPNNRTAKCEPRKHLGFYL